MIHNYPSDVAREQFNIIKDMLENARQKRKDRTVDLYDIFCAVPCLNKTGCPWRFLPSDFPNWNTVYYYFQIWTKIGRNGSSILSNALARLNYFLRMDDYRKENPSFLIIDSKSIRNACTAEEKGYDGGKKISGVKLHIAVDINGLPHSLLAATADVTDRDGAVEMFKNGGSILSNVKNILAGGSYTGINFADSVKKILNSTVEVVKRSELHKFVVIPIRWIVERSFGWLDHCRRLWKNCERKLNTTLQMAIIAFISIELRRFKF
jgi:transposase